MEPYNRVTVHGKRTRLAKVVWDKNHPDDPVRPGEIVHHKDGDKRNDSPENLEKLTAARHKSLHSQTGVNALARWRKEHPEEAFSVSSECAKHMLETLRSDPERYAEWQKRRVEATIEANKKRALPRDEWNRRRAEYMRKYRLRKKGIE